MGLTASRESGSGVRMASAVFAGALAGGASLLVSAPFHFVYFRHMADVKLNSAKSYEYANLKDMAGGLYSKGGFGGFFRGNFAQLYGIFVYRALYFGLYDGFRSILNSPSSDFVSNFIIGWGTTTLAGAGSYPFKVVSNRMMLDVGRSQRYFYIFVAMFFLNFEYNNILL